MVSSKTISRRNSGVLMLTVLWASISEFMVLTTGKEASTLGVYSLIKSDSRLSLSRKA